MIKNPTPLNSPIAHVVERLRAAKVVPDPFPHFCLENVFPEDYYQEILRHLLGSEAYQNLFEITTLKLVEPLKDQGVAAYRRDLESRRLVTELSPVGTRRTVSSRKLDYR